jgi:hypothetical protein
VQILERRSISLLRIILKTIALDGGSRDEALHAEGAVFLSIRTTTSRGEDAATFATWQSSGVKHHSRKKRKQEDGGNSGGQTPN